MDNIFLNYDKNMMCAYVCVQEWGRGEEGGGVEGRRVVVGVGCGCMCCALVDLQNSSWWRHSNC